VRRGRRERPARSPHEVVRADFFCRETRAGRREVSPANSEGKESCFTPPERRVRIVMFDQGRRHRAALLRTRGTARGKKESPITLPPPEPRHARGGQAEATTFNVTSFYKSERRCALLDRGRQTERQWPRPAAAHVDAAASGGGHVRGSGVHGLECDLGDHGRRCPAVVLAVRALQPHGAAC